MNRIQHIRRLAATVAGLACACRSAADGLWWPFSDWVMLRRSRRPWHRPNVVWRSCPGPADTGSRSG